MKSESDFVQWVEFSDNHPEVNILNFKILFGCIYIPPENSKFSSVEAFTEIEDELVFFSGNNNKNIALVGDFNSRTGRLSDIVELDDSLFDILDITDVAEFINENLLFCNFLKNKGIPVDRFSEDGNNVNNYGRKLIDFCKRCSLYMANGRLHNDKFIGKNTCKDASLVDYLLLSSSVFEKVSEFEIFDFNPMFSDVHNQMHFSIKFPHEVSHKNTNDIHGCTHVKWNPNKAEEFSQVLHNDNENILREINHTLSNTTTDSVTHGQVNDLLNELGNVLIRTATSVFGSTTKGKKDTTSNNKPWFNNDCKHKRDEFHKTRKRLQEIQDTRQ